jgi:DNA (cytosine-5)-methyltransferase 1
MKYFSMFSGIGGFELGIQRAEAKSTNSTDSQSGASQLLRRSLCVGFSEVDKYAIQIYQKHFPNHKGFGDATKINTADLPDFDFLCGGFPCQAFSVAGKRGGFQDTRGTLFFEIARILADKKPKHFLLENVKGLLSHDAGRTFQTIIRTLTDLGYGVEWQVLNSKDFGVPKTGKGCSLSDILEDSVGERYFLSSGQTAKLLNRLSEEAKE